MKKSWCILWAGKYGNWIFSFANEYVQPANSVSWLVSDKWNYLETEEWNVTELY